MTIKKKQLLEDGCTSRMMGSNSHQFPLRMLQGVPIGEVAAVESALAREHEARFGACVTPQAAEKKKATLRSLFSLKLWRRRWDSPTCCRPPARKYARVFESHPQGAQAPCSPALPRKRKKRPCGRFFL
jgi:hypothetical protein